MLVEHITPFYYIPEIEGKKTNTISKIVIGIVVIAIIIGGVFAGLYFTNQNSPNHNTHSNPN